MTSPDQRLNVGTKVGPYEVVGFIDEGGMGQVYRARDSRLNRDVAVKILPRESSHDSSRNERFMREARILSSLNHPYVSAIYDVGEYEGRTFLVMEYVDGEPLDVRIAKRPFQWVTVATLGAQIASALDAAHRRGFVHRDLKPSNIMVAGAGVKLLDFGIAKLLEQPVSPADQLREPTASDVDAIPGTTPYLAPEQLDGRPVDARADLFALGIVLYEMLTGRRPFRGVTRAAVAAAILEKPPEPLGLPIGNAPPELERLISKCLEKDPELRWQNARDLATELAWMAQDAERPTPAQVRAALPLSARIAVFVALVAAGTATAFWFALRAEEPDPVFRFTVTPPSGLVMAGTRSFVLSPSGRHIAFVGSVGGGPSLLWVQPLDSYAAQPIRGTDDAWHPFWSSDGRHVAFFAGTKVKAANIATGAVRTLTDLADATRASQGAWGNGVLVIGSGRTVYQLPEQGGAPVRLRLTDGDREVPAFSFRFLPDGQQFLFRGSPADRGDGDNIYLASVSSGTARPLMRADSQVEYTDPGYLLFMRGADLLAQRFDPGRRALQGGPHHVPEGVSRSTRLGSAIFSASQSGVLAYEADAIVTQLVWHDRLGRRLGTLGEPGLYTNPALAPDGSRALVTRVDPSTGGSDIWVIDADRGSRALTATPGTEDYALWSPEGDAVIFASDRTGPMRMYEKPADAPASRVEDEKQITGATPGRDDNWPMEWNASGQFVLFQGGGGGPGIPPLLFSLSRASQSAEPAAVFPPRPWRGEIQEAAQARTSPDGQWLAYVADIGGSPQVYVRSFSNSAQLWQVSTNGGYEPKWRGDGKELFYVAPDRTVMALDLACRVDCTLGKPHPLFRVAGIGAPLRKGSIRNEYDVTADGERFLINEPVDGVAAYSIRIVVNALSLLAP